jgi:drug/metabolite transporter (DMT)-like permease
VSRLPRTSAPGRMYHLIAAFFVVLGVVYTLTDDEPAGVVLLFGAAALAVVTGLALDLVAREGLEGEMAPEEYESGDLYLPHASAAPFALGVGATAIAAGIALGIWVIALGAAVFGFGLVGFVVQSRRRS